MLLFPMLLSMGLGLGLTYWKQKNKPAQPSTPSLPSATTPQVIESADTIRKRLAQTGRGTTIFTGGLFDHPAGRKEKLIPA